MNSSKYIVSRLLCRRSASTSTSSFLSVHRFYTAGRPCSSNGWFLFNQHNISSTTGSGTSFQHFAPVSTRTLNTSQTATVKAEQLRNQQDPDPSESETQRSDTTSSQIEHEQTSPVVDDELEHITLKLTPEEIQELTNGDEELIRKIKLIQMEHELARQDGARVPPDPIKLKKWKELLDLKSRSSRMKYFHYLWNCQMGDLSAKRKKEEKREKREAELSASPMPSMEEDPHGVFYALGRNTLFLRLYDSTTNRFYHGRLASAAQFNQTLVIDCGYDEHMCRAEAKNCAGQLEYLFTDNKVRAKEPLNVVLCNVNKEDKFMQALVARVPTLYEDSFMVQVFEESYLDLFPKERLVYLTPHARDEFMEYDEDDVYIVGAMVDKSDPRPFSMAKAKREGLRTAKLPLDQYLQWGGGSGKSLTVNQMGAILIDFSNTKDWTNALRHVPTRKLRRADDQFNPTDRFILKQPKRKEKTSQVLLDFEMESSRKGFGFKGNHKPLGPELNRDRFRPDMKSILRDD